MLKLPLMEKLKLAGILRVDIERSYNKMKIFIHVTRPGVVIGRGGSGLELIKKTIYVRAGRSIDFDFNVKQRREIDVEDPWH